MDSIKNILSWHESSNNVDEKELQLKMENYLSRYFHIESEVKSTDWKGRIDLIVIHKTDISRKYPIGIEIKVNAKKTGKDIAAWLRQANGYANMNFIGYGKCLIVTCPQISGLYMREGELMHQHENDEGCPADHNVSTFVGHFGIGEVQKYVRNNKRYLRIVFKGKILWEQHNNIFRYHNYDALCQEK